MPDGLGHLFRATKDATVSLAARSYVNTKLHGIGTVTELSIDTTKRRIHARLELIGEAEPIAIDVTRFDVTQREGESRITILEVSTSRQWLTEALRQFVIGKSFAIPPQAGAVLKA